MCKQQGACVCESVLLGFFGFLFSGLFFFFEAVEGNKWKGEKDSIERG